MVKQVSEEEYARILSLISKCQEGVALRDLMGNSEIDESRSTLIRRLDTLTNLGKIYKKGIRKSARYFMNSLAPEVENWSPEMQISKEGAEILKYLKKPLPKRKPVSYRIDFLDQYVPNKTSYLSEEVKEELKRIGNQPDGHQPAGTFARQIFNRLLVDLSWNSSRLEGNTYSQLETKNLLELGESAAGKSRVEAQMILNHKEAIEFLLENADQINFDRYTICNLHALLSEGLLANKQACGRVRSIKVGISGTCYAPLQIPQQIEEMFELFLTKAAVIQDPIEQAFFSMVHLPYLQIFEHVNKRVSRLCTNIPLIKSNLCPLSFVGVPKETYVQGILGVYERNQITLLRDIFIWAYKRSAIKYSAIRHTIGEPDLFETRYRLQIKKLVSEIVKSVSNSFSTVRLIQEWCKKNIPKADQEQFQEKVESELLGLHIGNIARFKIKPTEFELWKKEWK